MTRPVEFMDQDGDSISWYCGVCGRELGADLDSPTGDGMPPAGCPEHGDADLAWECWNRNVSPMYPHKEEPDG